MPLFLTEKKGAKEAIKSMPGRYRYGRDLLLQEVKELHQLGIQCVCLFPTLEDRKRQQQGQVRQ